MYRSLLFWEKREGMFSSLCFSAFYAMIFWLKYLHTEEITLERKQVLVPEADLARQRDFEEKIRAMFTAREAHPVACVDTFGCQQNVADGQG